MYETQEKKQTNKETNNNNNSRAKAQYALRKPYFSWGLIRILQHYRPAGTTPQAMRQLSRSRGCRVLPPAGRRDPHLNA